MCCTLELPKLVLSLMVVLTNSITFFYQTSLPISLNLSIIIAFILFIVLDYQSKKIGITSLIIIGIYALPFIHLFPYLWFDFSSQPFIMWGLVANPYSWDINTISILCGMASTGLGAFVFVNSFLKPKINRDSGIYLSGRDITRKYTTPLPLPIFSLFLLTALYLSYITAPSDNIFQTKYAHASSVSRDITFASAWVGSYVLIIFSYLDAVLERRREVRLIKKIVAYIIIFYITIILQFLRGDRAVLTLLLSLFLIHTYWCGNYRLKKLDYKLNFSLIVLFIFLIFTVSFMIALVRSNVSGSDLLLLLDLIVAIAESDDFDVSTFLKGTWTAVLLTPLSVAGDYTHNLMKFNYGSDYWNLLISLPPGFVADLFGYHRPFSNGMGPATEMRFGQGGTHATVLPFRAFGLPGIFGITAVWYTIVVKVEAWLLGKFKLINVAALAMLVTMSPHWLWYGEKNIINGVIFYFIVCALYVCGASINNLRTFRYVY